MTKIEIAPSEWGLVQYNPMAGEAALQHLMAMHRAPITPGDSVGVVEALEVLGDTRQPG